MRRLISLAFVLLVGIVGYNYFFGDETEKEQARNIVKKTKDIGLEIKSLVQDEKDRYEDGKYDNVINKIKNVVSKDEELSKEYADDLNEIEEIQKDLEREQRKKQRNSDSYDEQKEKLLKEQLEGLLNELSDSMME